MKEVVRLEKNRGEPKKRKKQTKQVITLETPLTVPQEQFCVEYSKSGRGAESYKKSYPKCTKTTTATAGASRLLTYVNIQKRLEELRIATESNSIASITEIKEFWTTFLRDTSLEPKERTKASELLAKTYGAFLDKIEVKQDENTLSALDRIEQIVKKRFEK